MAFKMNKDKFDFGEGTNTPNKFLGKVGKFLGKAVAGGVGAAADAIKGGGRKNDPNLEANKAQKATMGGGTSSDEKVNAINEILNS
tara:strand:- start:528 stop:785 length:258 start_codon:yes stop_codon:yes gene_type:complete